MPTTPRPRRRRRGLLLLGAGALVLASLAAVILALTRGQERVVNVAPNSVAVIDPETSRVVDAIAVGESPGPIAANRDGLWVVNLNDRTLTKIEAATRSVAASVGLPTLTGFFSTSLRLAITPDDVWVFACHQRLIRVDPENAQIVQDLEIFREIGAAADYSCAVAATPSSVWVPLDYPRSELFRVAVPQSGPALIAERIPLPSGVHTAITVGAGSVWIADSEGAVRRLDPATGAVTRTISLTNGPSAMVVGHGAVWVANKTEDSVLRIQPSTNSIVRAISVGADPVALSVGADAIWVANSGDGTVSRIDPATNTVIETIRVGHRPLGVAVADDFVWVTVRS